MSDKAAEDLMETSTKTGTEEFNSTVQAEDSLQSIKPPEVDDDLDASATDEITNLNETRKKPNVDEITEVPESTNGAENLEERGKLATTSNTVSDPDGRRVPSQSVRSSGRDRHLTERGIEFQTSTRERTFRLALLDWKRIVAKIKGEIASAESTKELKTCLPVAEAGISAVSVAYAQLEKLVPESEDNFAKIDEAQDQYASITTQIAERQRELALETRSVMSIQSHHSRQSNLSKSSNQSQRSLRIQAKSEAASLEARLRGLQDENRKKLEIQKLQSELEERKAKTDLEAAQAALRVIEEEDTQGSNPLLEEDVMSTTEKVERFIRAPNDEHVAEPTVTGRQAAPPTRTTTRNTQDKPVTPEEGSHSRRYDNWQNHHPSTVELNPMARPFQPIVETQVTPSSQNNSEADGIAGLLRTFAEQANLQRLPQPEPGLFGGDPLSYPRWKKAFDALVSQKGIPLAERLYYLDKYLTGSAKEAIEGYIFLPTETSYQSARDLLEVRFGDPFVVGNAFRDKIESWPRVTPRDGPGLRRLTDFLHQCLTAMSCVPNLQSLSDERENRRILAKLPDWLINRWARKVADIKNTDGRFPTFQEFVRFLQKEADIACDPLISSLPARSAEKHKDHNESDKGHPRKRGPATVTHSTRAEAIQDKKVAGTAKTQDQDKRPRNCTYCNKDHEVAICVEFNALSYTDKVAFIKKRGMCFGCLRRGHLSVDCKNRKTCDTCGKRHPTALHSVPKEANGNNSTTTVNSVSHYLQQGYGCSKSTMIVPVIISHRDQPKTEMLVYALLDTQSDSTFVSQRVVNQLGIRGEPIDLRISTMTSIQERVKSLRVEGLMVRGYNLTENIGLHTAYTRECIPANKNHIPSPRIAAKWPHLAELSSHIPPPLDCEVELLIGYDCPQILEPKQVIPSPGRGPYGQRSILGWGIVGLVEPDSTPRDPIGFSHKVAAFCESDSKDTPISSLALKTTVLSEEITRMFEVDFLESPTEDITSQEDLKFLDIMKQGIFQGEDHHYEMPLPFKDGPPQIPSNREAMRQRLMGLRKKFSRDSTFHKEYTTFMNNIIQQGYAEPISKAHNTEGKTWYLPHHGVFSNRNPNKLRVVFDASSSFQGISLNDHLLQGPDLANNLIGILCRFRLEEVALSCDVKQMFFQFRVTPEHRDYLRFWWFPKGNIRQDPCEYRMKVHLFGARSSPSCAAFGLRQIASDYESTFGRQAADFLRHDFYVDDGLKSVSTVQEAIELIETTKNMCKGGGLILHKFLSNHQDVLSRVNQEDDESQDHSKPLPESLLLSQMTDRTLGVQWCTKSDTLSLSMKPAKQANTRRAVLSTVSSIYDPLGFAAPFILRGKQILQGLCKETIGWDEEIPESFWSQWQSWCSELQVLQELQIPRCIKPKGFGRVVHQEIHHFSDASESGYGQCSYMRTINEKGEVHCALIMGKSRVAPLKTVSIPRMELTAAVVSVKVSTFLQRELQRNDVQCQETFWTDSTVVLGYINNDSKRFRTFVANRVQQIKNRTTASQWKHVRSEENPADLASRGMPASALNLNSMWLRGPPFLWKIELPQQSTQPVDLEPNDPEIKKVEVKATISRQPSSSMFAHMSRWSKIVTVVRLCLKLKFILRNKQRKSDRQDIIVEQQEATRTLFKMIQQESFEKEIQALSQEKEEKRRVVKGGPLAKLDPFIDKQGIIRVGGRLRASELPFEVKHPTVIPKSHYLTELIVRHYHEKCKHGGRGMTSNEIRSNGLWILGMSRVVRAVISRCVHCRRWRGSTQTPKMADLPEDRTVTTPPFTYCGVDLFGPWNVKNGRRNEKRFGVLFTCLMSRAVHIEVAATLSTDSFICALRRFIAIRGPIRQLRSDRGTNFCGSIRELEWEANLDDTKIEEFLNKGGADYVHIKMNAPSSSHAGGVWERQIRTIRNILTSLLIEFGNQLNDEALATVMAEAAAICNSRPITVDTLNDPASLLPLNPNNLLTLKSKLILPPPGVFQREDIYSRKYWRRVQYILEIFWSRWRKEYLSNLQIRNKWLNKPRNLMVGDIVIIKDDNLPRNCWRLGKITDVKISTDGHVRSVFIRTGDPALDKTGRRISKASVLERPAQKVVLLMEAEP